MDTTLVASLRIMKCLLVILLVGRVRCEVEMNEDGQSGTISFQTPSLNDEEAHSLHLPERLLCDACTAIAFQFTKKFDAAHEKMKSLKRLPESDVLRIVDEVCSDKYEQYGIKEINKVKRLSGPGLEGESVPGIMQGGGRWPDRLQRTCYKYMEEIEDEDLYNAYHKNKNGLQALMCKTDISPGLTDVCLEKKKSRTKKKSGKQEL